MYKLFQTILFLIILGTLMPMHSAAQEINIINLKTEYTEHPLGMDVTHPRFSWQMQSAEYGAKQTAYQITVVDEEGAQVWNSGKVYKDISLNIRYAGMALKPRTRYTWNVTVWGQHQKKHDAQSWFETGLMKTDSSLSAWNHAKWIGGDDKDMVLYAQYLPVFRMDYTMQLDEASRTTRAGFVYGANDCRLMDKNKNLYGIASSKGSSYIRLELDVAPLQANDSAQLHIYRAGYAPQDKSNIPFKSFAIPLSLLNKQNRYAKHTFYLSSVLGDTHIYMDGTKKENLLCSIGLNPLGQGGDFIAFPVVGDIGLYAPAGQRAFFSDIEIRNYRSPSKVLFSENLNDTAGIFSKFNNEVVVNSGAYCVTGKEGDALVIADPSRNAMPMLRTVFSSADAQIVKARLYVTARGIYEMYINGKKIGNDYFNPGLTQYNKTQLYQTFDVTNDVRSGNNALCAVLGEGWWSGGATYMGYFWNFFGDRQSLLAQLIVTYDNGKEEVITTNPESWRYCNNGAVVYGSFFQGEVYDATKESLTKGWTTAAYDDSQWEKATEVTLKDHTSLDKSNEDFNMPMVDDYSRLEIKGQYGPTVQKVQELSAVAVDEVRHGVFIYDMGQNMAGVPKIIFKGMKPGSRIVLRYAEVKYPDLSEYKGHAGMLMLENIRAAMAQDIYIAKGGDEVFSPRFTYHGYRYIEITGIPQALPLYAVKGEALSSVHELSSKYETSSASVNKLWQNITWSLRANFMSIPTDCPQRNERLGWSGDISVFSRTETYLVNVPEFLRRHMQAMRDVQRGDGRFPDVAPLGGGFGGVLWGSAGITVAWESYEQYGDKDLLVEHYAAMKCYIRFLLTEIDPKTGVLDEKDRGKWSSLGDWLSPQYQKDEKTLLWEAYFIYDLEIMNKVAVLLDKKEDATWFNNLCIKRKAFFNNTYVDKRTGKTVFRGKPVDTQTSYVLPLQFKIFNAENTEAVREHLAATVMRENKADDGTLCPPYSLVTGFIGTAWISSALSDNGYNDMAYRLLQQTSYPSWLYPVTQGATTIWERLNSYTNTNGFGGNNRMNSFNHYSFGAVGSWMYAYSLGIQRDENSPGFKHFILKPQPDPTGKMTYAKGYYDAMYGRIESSWKISGKACVYHFVIPANTTATLYVSAASIKNIVENGKAYNETIDGTKYLGKKDGNCIFELSSGSYEFCVRNIR